MSEYWISKKKYFCQYCDTYIADDVPSRAHHESGMRHKGNKERFVRGLYKTGEKRKRDEEEERRAMKGVEEAALRAFEGDVSAGRAGPTTEVTRKAPQGPPVSRKSGNPYQDYTTAESLGYKDLDVERAMAETERRLTQGLVGDWELLPVASTSTSASALGDITHLPKRTTVAVEKDSTPVDVVEWAWEEMERRLTQGVPGGPENVKYKSGPHAEAAAAAAAENVPTPVDDNGEDAQGWKLRKKTARVGDWYDPGVIAIKVKPKAEAGSEAASGIVPATSTGDDGGGPKSTNVPIWTTMEWKKAGVQVEPTPSSAPPAEPALKAEPEPEPEPEPSLQETKTEDASTPPPPPGGLFKKRKMRAGGAGRRDQF